MKTLLSALLFITFSSWAQVYSPQDALADLKAEKLSFVSRDYPNADLGPGGSYDCFYKNSRVFVRHEGCRPNYNLPMAVFSAKITSRNGGMVELYLEHRRDNYNIQNAGPEFEGTWRIASRMTPVIEKELSFKEIVSLEEKWNRIPDYCSISKSIVYPDQIPQINCHGEASDPQDNLSRMWHEPKAEGLLELHDLILKAPRK